MVGSVVVILLRIRLPYLHLGGYDGQILRILSGPPDRTVQYVRKEVISLLPSVNQSCYNSAVGLIAFGELAQLGERVVRNHEVRGSIPLFSTTRTLKFQRSFYSIRKIKCMAFLSFKFLSAMVSMLAFDTFPPSHSA